MRFEWDAAKRKESLIIHGVDFADLPPLFEGLTVTVLVNRVDYGEDRYVNLVAIREIVLTVAHTETDDLIRLISARKPTSNEEEDYFKQIRD